LTTAPVYTDYRLDEEVLRHAGVTDFAKYRHPGVSEEELIPDFFV
jgi:hypothetical protein